MTTGPREARIEVRTSREQKDLITRGARVQGQNVTDFILSSAQEKAELILAEQKDFELPEDRWKAFVAALDRPVNRHERLARLMSEPSILER